MGVRLPVRRTRLGVRPVSVPSERGMGVRQADLDTAKDLILFQSPLSGVWACACPRRYREQISGVSVPSERGMGVRPDERLYILSGESVSVPSERGMGVRPVTECMDAQEYTFQSPLSGVWACALKSVRADGGPTNVSVPSERGMGVRRPGTPPVTSS